MTMPSRLAGLLAGIILLAGCTSVTGVHPPAYRPQDVTEQQAVSAWERDESVYFSRSQASGGVTVEVANSNIVTPGVMDAGAMYLGVVFDVRISNRTSARVSPHLMSMTLVDEFGRAWTARGYHSTDLTGGYSLDVPPGATRTFQVGFMSQYATLAHLPNSFVVRIPVFDGRGIPEHTFSFRRITWQESSENVSARKGANFYALVGSGFSRMPPVAFEGGERQWGMPLSLGLGLEVGRFALGVYPFDWHLEFGSAQEGGGHDGRFFNGSLAEVEFAVTERIRLGGGYRLNQSILGQADQAGVEPWHEEQPNVPFGQITFTGKGGDSYAQTNRWYVKLRGGPDFLQAYFGGGFFIR